MGVSQNDPPLDAVIGTSKGHRVGDRVRCSGFQGVPEPESLTRNADQGARGGVPSGLRKVVCGTPDSGGGGGAVEDGHTDVWPLRGPVSYPWLPLVGRSVWPSTFQPPGHRSHPEARDRGAGRGATALFEREATAGQSQSRYVIRGYTHTQPHRREIEMASTQTGGRQGGTPEPQSIVLVIDFPQDTERLDLKALMADLRAQVRTRGEEWLDENRPGARGRVQVQVTIYEVETKRLHIAQRLR